MKRKSRSFKPGDIVVVPYKRTQFHGVVVKFLVKKWAVLALDYPNAKHNFQVWRVPEEYMTKVPDSRVPQHIWGAFMKWKHGVRS